MHTELCSVHYTQFTVVFLTFTACAGISEE